MKKNNFKKITNVFVLVLIKLLLMVPVLAAEIGFTSVSAGGLNSAALFNSGDVYVWGYNWYGEVGDGTTIRKIFPVKLQGLENVVAIESGYTSTFAIDKSGRVWSWGNNESGQLGDGTKLNKLKPVLIEGLSDVISIAAGHSHTLALKNDGTVWAWGKNEYGQLGDGSKKDKLVPVHVKGLDNVKAIASGWSHSIVLKRDGAVWIWGDNSSDQFDIGYGLAEPNIPIQVEGLSGIEAIAAGPNHTLALKSDGTVWTWGDNFSGQLGDGTTNDRRKPEIVLGLSNIKHIEGGWDDVSYAVNSEGNTWVWGSNFKDLIMEKGFKPYLSPTKIEELTNVKFVTGGQCGGFVLKSNGSVWGWGINGGYLGDGTEFAQLKPIKILDAKEPPAIRIKMFIKNSTINHTKGWTQLKIPPFIKSGITMVPLRFVSETLGANVKWNEKEKKILVNGIKNVTLWIGKSYAVIDGQQYLLEASPELKSGIVSIPLRFVSEHLGAQVIYDQRYKSIEINKIER